MALLSDDDVFGSAGKSSLLSDDDIFGVAPKKQNKGIIADIGTGLKRGVEQMPGMVTGIADIVASPISAATGTNRPVSRAADWLGEQTGFQPGKWAEEAAQEYSPEMQQSLKNVQDAKGFLPTIGAIAENPRSAVNLVAESLPSTLVGGVLARGAMGAVAGAEKLAAMKAAGDTAGLLKAGAIAGGIGEGIVTAGQQMSQTDYNVDPLKAAGAAIAAGGITGAIGAGSGRLASSAIGRKLGLSDLETSMAAGTLGQNMAKAGPAAYAKRIGAGVVQEGLLEEAPQSYSEQVWQNLANGKPWNEGAAEAAAQGAVAGGVMGGGINAIPRFAGDNKAEEAPPIAPIPKESITLTTDPAPLQGRIDAMLGIGDKPMTEAQQAQYAKDLNAAFGEVVGYVAGKDSIEVPVTMEDYLRSTVAAADIDRNKQAPVQEQPAPIAEQAAPPEIPVSNIPVVGPLSKIGNAIDQAQLTQQAVADQSILSGIAKASPAQPEKTMTEAGLEQWMAQYATPEALQRADMKTATGIAARATTQPQPTSTTPLQQSATTLTMPGGIASAAKPAPLEQKAPQANDAQVGAVAATAQGSSKTDGEAAVNRLVSDASHVPLGDISDARRSEVTKNIHDEIKRRVDSGATEESVWLAIQDRSLIASAIQAPANDVPADMNKNQQKLDTSPERVKETPKNEQVQEVVKQSLATPVEQSANDAKSNQAKFSVSPIVEAMIGTAYKSADEMRSKISNVKYGDIVDGVESINFSLNGKQYSAKMTGRNRDFVLAGNDSETDRAYALRALLDGGVTPTAPATHEAKKAANLARLEKARQARAEKKAAAQASVVSQNPQSVSNKPDSVSPVSNNEPEQSNKPEIVKVKDVYGNYHHVLKRELDAGKTLLRLHTKDGERKTGEHTHLNIENIDNDGSKTKEAWKDVSVVAGKDLSGLKTRAAIVAEINKLGQDQAEFDIKQSDSGAWYATRKKAGEEQKPAEPVAQPKSEPAKAQAPATKEKTPVFKNDVPNESWLNEQIDYAKSKPRNEFGVPYMGKTTGYFKGENPAVSVDALSSLKGERGEQGSIRKNDLDWLVSELKANGLKNVGVPYIEIGYDGVPWVSEGNHRIMAAKQLGWKTMPVEIRYFDGGERNAGSFAPNAILVKETKPATVDAVKQPETKAAEQEAKPAEKIDDFGAKLGGARKDLEADLRKEWSDDEIAQSTLSKVWPKADVNAIEDAYVAAFAHAARAEIPSKPRVAYKVDRWVQQVKLLRGLTLKVADGKISNDAVNEAMSKNRTLQHFTTKVSLLEAIDRANWDRIGEVAEYPDAYRYSRDGKEKIQTPMVSVRIDGKVTNYDGKTLADVLGKVREALGEAAPGQKMQFEVRGHPGAYFINKKGDPLYRRLKKFDTSKDALNYRDSNYADLVAAWDAVKDSDNVKETDVRSKDNRPRTGADRRNGKDVTPQQFTDELGFRGVEFGNWVAQGKSAKERQGMLNQAYDALMDLADIVGIPPKAISLNGTLGLGFGSRGHGWASAHFESGNLVINLTKTRGAGSLAHEWLHALDNYFQRARGDRNNKYGSFITFDPENYYVGPNGFKLPERAYKVMIKGERHPDFGTLATRYRDPAQWKLIEGVRPEVGIAFADLVKALNESPMAKRASLIDKGKSGGYWSRIIERAARSFENYVIAKMAQSGYHNDYLANVTAVEDFARDKGRYPYLLPEEVAPVSEAFDNLFNTLEAKETDQGIALYSKSKRMAGDSGLGKVEIKPATSIKPIADILAAENATQVVVKGGNVDALNRVAKLFGKQIIFFRTVDGNQSENGAVGAQSGRADSGANEQGNRLPADGYITNGFVNTGRPDTVFLNVDSSNHLLYILGHELGHTLRMDDPKLWASMAKQLQPLIIRWSQYKANMSQTFADESTNAEELFGDIIGQNFLNQEFWNELAQENQSLFQKIANTAIKILNKAMSLIAGKDVSIYVSDMKQARAVIAKTMAQYAENKGMYQALANQYDGEYINKRSSSIDNALGNLADQSNLSPADKAIYGMVAEGKSAADILKFIASASRSPFYRMLAKVLQKTGIAPTMTLGEQSNWKMNAGNDKKYAAAYDPKTNTVALFRAGSAERHVLHELMHAATIRALAKNGLASAQMKMLFSHVKRSGSLTGQYGMTDIDEFVAEAFSNPKFQELLKQVAAPTSSTSTLKSAWNWFVNIVRGILGIPKSQENALSKALEIGLGVMRENMRLQSGDGVIRFNHALRSNSTSNQPINATRLAKLRGIAAGLERPKDAVFLRVTEDGKAITTGPKGVRIPESFIRFAEDHGLDFEARRNGEGRRNDIHTIGGHITSKTEPMPAEYRESGALYFGEGNEYFDRTGKTRYNAAQGNIAAVNQTDTPNFKRWFGDSVVTHNGKPMSEGGKPIVVYHGSRNSGFAEFDTKGGAFFHSNFAIAGSYGGMDEVEFSEDGKGIRGDRSLYEVYLRIKNPKVIDFAGKNNSQGPDGLTLEQWVNRAKADGFDGIIAENVEDLPDGNLSEETVGTVYVVFDQTQIKSATDNNGDFSPTNPDIRYNIAGSQTRDVNDYQKRADQLDRAFTAMGLDSRRESSKGSQSEYVIVQDPNNEDESYKFRVSNHQLPSGYAQPDFDVIANDVHHGGHDWNMAGTWIDAINWISDKTGAAPRGIVKTMSDKRRKEIATNAAAESAEREMVKAQYANLNSRIVEEKIKLSEWLDTLPEESILAVSKKGNLSATAPGVGVVSYGAKPFGMANSTKTIADARKYIESAPTPNNAATRLPGVPESGMQERPKAEPAQSGSGAGSENNIARVEEDGNRIRYNVADDIRSHVPPMIQKHVSLAFDNQKSTSWLTAVNTQYHKALKWAGDGKPLFKRVFDLGQEFVGDVSRFAVMSQNAAPTMFNEWQSVGDVATAIRNTRSIRDLTGKNAQADIDAAAKPIFDGTLYGGGNPMNGVKFSDAKLRSEYKLTDKQIKLYHEALAAVNVSMDELAKSIIAKHAKNNSLPFDHSMSVEDMAESVSDGLDALREEALMRDDQKAADLLEKTMADVTSLAEKNQKLQDAGYFPLMRFGDHTVTATDAEGKVQYFNKFEGVPLIPKSAQYQANREAAKLKAEHPEWTVRTGIQNTEAHKMFGGLNIDALKLFADHMDAESKAPYQEFLRVAVNERSVMKRMMHRKGTPGYSEDIRRTLASFIVSNARAASSNYHLFDMRKATVDAEQDGGDIGREAVKLFEEVSNPVESATKLRGFLFFNYLGGSVASAAINMTQIPMMTFPKLSQYAKVNDLVGMLGKAAKMAVMNPANVQGEVGKALRRAELDGVTAPQEIFQLTGTAANSIFTSNKGANFLLQAWGKPFALAEAFNRRTTFITAYQIAAKMTPAQLKETGAKSAFEFAETMVKETQGIYNAGNRPNIGRGAVGATMMTFKQYSIMYMELLSRLPLKQQAMMLGMLLLAAGAGGLPFEEDAEDIIDTIGQWMGYATNTRKSLRNAVEGAIGKTAADVALNGVMDQMGLSLSARMGMHNLLPGSGILKQSSVDKGRDVQEFFGPAASVIASFGKALENLATGHPDRAALAMAPVAVQNAVRGLNMMNTGYAEDMKGRRTIPVSGMEGFAKSLGFNPKSVAQFGDIKRDMSQDQRLMQVRRESFTSAMADAIISGDMDARNQAISDMKEWNLNNPNHRVMIDMRSVAQRVRAAKMEGVARFLKSTPKTMRAEAIEEFSK